MPTKTKRMHVACEFGGVSLRGDGAARIGIKISRDDITLEQADAYLCGRRLTGKLTITSGDSPDQGKIVDDLDPELNSTFDVKRISVSPSEISCSLSFILDEKDLESFAHFGKRKGRILVDSVETNEVEDDEEVG